MHSQLWDRLKSVPFLPSSWTNGSSSASMDLEARSMNTSRPPDKMFCHSYSLREHKSWTNQGPELLGHSQGTRARDLGSFSPADRDKAGLRGLSSLRHSFHGKFSPHEAGEIFFFWIWLLIFIKCVTLSKFQQGSFFPHSTHHPVGSSK